MVILVSHLEKWISEFSQQGTKGGTPLKHYPSLPWLQLTQLGFKLGCSRVSLQTSYRHIRFDLENWHPQPEDLETVENFPEPDESSPLNQALQLLLTYKPTALSVSWQCAGKSGAWVLRPGSAKQAYPAPQRRVDAFMVHISWKPSAVSAWRAMERRHRAILEEYVRRTHFSPRPILIQGRLAPSDLDFAHVQSRLHRVAAVLAGPLEEAIACAPPIIYNPQRVTLNGTLLQSSEGISEGLTGATQVAHYALIADQDFERVAYDLAEARTSRRNLDHSELLVAYDSSQAPERFQRVALAGTQAYLLPARKVGPSWMVRYSIRPYRVARLFCLSTQDKVGTGTVLPVRQGVCLAPISLAGLPEKSLIVTVCPPHLRVDAPGMRLLEDEACSAWLSQLLAEAGQVFD